MTKTTLVPAIILTFLSANALLVQAQTPETQRRSQNRHEAAGWARS
jgi:hypothetical protein